MNTYKYFLIYDRYKHILYGECIEWRCGEFDSQRLRDVTVNLKKKFKARLITSDKRLEVIDDVGVINFPEVAFFNYEERYDDFITQKSDEVIFSPLIDRCSDINSFVGKEKTGVEFIHWTEDHEKLLADIKARFDLDLLKRPELINSYTFYNPTRLIVKCQFTEKPDHEERRLPTNLKVKFYDEFTEYQNSSYEVIGHCMGGDPESHKGMVSVGCINIEFNESPEQLEVLITKEGKCIYNSKHGFIRTINVVGKVIGDTVTLENGSKVSKYSSLDIEVGKDK
jgi:hypothetical protein